MVHVAITLVLADDHEVMRSGLRRLLQDEDDLDVVAEAGDVLTAFRLVRMHNPDVLVLDLNMPGGSPAVA
jgi:two-component system response regulator NreC